MCVCAAVVTTKTSPTHHLLPPNMQVYPMMRSYAPAERSICPVEREAYLAKLQELQQYVPSLVRALSQLSRGRMDERGRESFRKLQFILRVLQDKTTRSEGGGTFMAHFSHFFFVPLHRVSLSSLMTYEFAIKKICASRLAQTERASKRTLDLEVCRCYTSAFRPRTMHTHTHIAPRLIASFRTEHCRMPNMFDWRPRLGQRPVGPRATLVPRAQTL